MPHNDPQRRAEIVINKDFKSNSGDRQLTFPNDIGRSLLWNALAHSWEFTADEFHRIAGVISS